MLFSSTKGQSLWQQVIEKGDQWVISWFQHPLMFGPYNFDNVEALPVENKAEENKDVFYVRESSASGRRFPFLELDGLYL